MDNGDNNNYYKLETPNCDTPEYLETKSDDKYKNITNISQLSTIYLTQPKPNEFIAKSSEDFIIWIFFFVITSIGLFGILYILLFERSGIDSLLVFIITFIFLLLFNCCSLNLFLFSRLRQNIIFTEDYVQIKTNYVLYCHNWDKIYNYSNIKCFQLDKRTIKDEDGERTIINIICLDSFNRKNYLFFDQVFGLEEAEYFVFVANNFINKKNNMITIS